MDETRLAILRKTGGADVQDVIAAHDETRAQLAEEQTAHATLRALWDARCGTIASVQARLEEAEDKLRHNVRAEAAEWEDCPACDGTGRSCPARLDVCAICGGCGELLAKNST